ncbi:MAG: hypothetical protein IKX31_07020 [Muribaculaceae bacterium]|nr:hypothetical protein [Muribaculaceae bacterium]
MKKSRFIVLTVMMLVFGIAFNSCKDKEDDVTANMVTESSEYAVYQDGTMLSTSFLAWPTPSYALYVPADGATFRIDDVVNWMTDIELELPNGESGDYITVKPYYVNDNGIERIDYCDITFKANETGKRRTCGIRTKPFELIETGGEPLFVGTCFTAYQETK